MRGYSFDRSLAVERAKMLSPVFRDQQEEKQEEKKEAVLLYSTRRREDDVYVTPEPRVPPYVIWIAAGCVLLAVICWSMYSAAQSRRRLAYLEILVDALAKQQGLIVQRGF